jgi:DNA-binding MarR family transcriptional regulator
MSYVADVLPTRTEHAQLIHTVAVGAIGSDDLVSNVSISTLMLLHRDGPQRPKRIAELTGLTSGGATKLITRLDPAGLVDREAGAVATDGRAIVVSLTDFGREKTTRVVAAMAPHLDALVDELVALRVDA